jgi:hypothetical protein
MHSARTILAAGAPQWGVLYSREGSTIRVAKQYDPVYTNTPQRIIYDIKTGYGLVNSGRIGPSN